MLWDTISMKDKNSLRTKADREEAIKNRFRNALFDNKIYADVLEDFIKTFTSIGMNEEAAKVFSINVIDIIKKEATLEETESEMQELFKRTKVNGIPFFEKLSDAMRNREKIIVGQVLPYLKGIKGKVVDYGAGSGKVAQGIKGALGLDIEGFDVSSFKHPSVTIPLTQFNGRDVPVEDGHYEAAVITNVMHHEEKNEDIIKELSRIVSRKIVVIETIPLDESLEARERCFATDAFWNRFFFNAGVPVPGTYEMPEKWIERFKRYGWKCTVSEALGFDQPAVQDIHHLLSF